MIDLTASAIVGAVTSLGLTGAALWAAGRFLGEKLFGHWLEGRLQRQKQEHALDLEKLKGMQNDGLEKLKNEQNREIEKLRGDIGHLQDRGRRANEHEFAALGAICNKLEDLFDATNRCVVLYMQVPDLDHMDDETLTRLLDANEFKAGERTAMRSAKDKAETFSRIMTLRMIAQAQTAYHDFLTVLDRQSIFIPKPLEDRLRAAGDLCPGAIALREAEAQGRRPQGMMDDLEFRQKRTQVLDDIRNAVRERLQYEDRPGE